MPAHLINMRGNCWLSDLTETMSQQGHKWSFVQIGQELKELSRSQHRPIRCWLTSLICADYLINMRRNCWLSNLAETMSQGHNWSFVQIGQELKEWLHSQQQGHEWSFVQIGQELNELSHSQHRPIICWLTSLICAEIAGCRTWPRQCHKKAICEVEFKSVKN
jgi:hypothetical protein